MMQKVCAECGREKPLDDFHDNPKGLHGKAGKCKSCKSLYDKQRYLNSTKIHKKSKTKYLSPIPFLFDDQSIKKTESHMNLIGADSFSAAFKSIIEKAIDGKLYLKPNAFSRAKSILVQNRFQLFHVKSNLTQLYDGYMTGKVPGIDSQIEDLKILIEKYTQQIAKISNILKSDAFLKY